MSNFMYVVCVTLLYHTVGRELLLCEEDRCLFWFMVLTQETPPTSSLSAIGRAVKKIKADGNCFFRAVSFLVAGSENYHLEIRNLIIQFEEMNRGIFETYLLPLTNKPTFEEHLQLLHNPTSWATQTEVLAVATYFRVPVFYYVLQYEEDVSSH